MAIRTIKYKVELEGLYKIYLRVVNGILQVPLTETEIDILELIYKNGNRLDKDFRKVIQKELNMSEKNLNNYKSKLVKKQTLIDYSEYSAIHPSFLLPQIEQNKLPLFFMFDIKEESKEEGIELNQNQ